jgi:hypothetical protein
MHQFHLLACDPAAAAECGPLHMSRRTGSADRYHLLRVFKPPPRTTDRTVTMSVLHILRLAVFGHLLSATFNERV